MTLLCGIDEAGRGPVIGPLVVAGVLIEERFNHKLRLIGARDSKTLSPSKRESLFEEIKKAVKAYEIIIIAPQDVDRAVQSDTMNLNWLEALNMVTIINKLKPDKAILDCPSNNQKAFTEYVQKNLKHKNVEIFSEHKADANHPTVSAASILAKVTRDREIQKLKDYYKVDFGTGYPSDPMTKQFLERNWDKYNFFRKSWQSYQDVLLKKQQRRIGEF